MAAEKLTAQPAVGVPLDEHAHRTIPVLAFAMSLSLFLVISYVLCIIGYLIWPSLPINHAAFVLFGPSFQQLSWTLFCLGLVESFAFGWYIALIFGPLYNFFVTRWR